MSTARIIKSSSNQPAVTPEQPPSAQLDFVKQHFAPSAGSIAITHPLRVLMNRSYLHPTLFGVIKDLPEHGKKGFFLNLVRGTTILTAQSVGKDLAQYAYGDTQSSEAKLIGLMGAASAGSLTATVVETPFTRTTNESMHYQVQRLSITQGLSSASKPLFRFSPFLLASFFSRDVGFSYLVRIAKDLPPYVVIPTVPVAAFLTVSAQNIANRAATDDLLLPEHGSFPKWSVRKFIPIMSDIAKGTYTHPSYAVPNKSFSPEESRLSVTLKLVQNLVAVTCGKNMFFWRSAYIASVFGSLALIQGIISPPAAAQAVNSPKPNASLSFRP